jgi:hypothetical protein
MDSAIQIPLVDNYFTKVRQRVKTTYLTKAPPEGVVPQRLN